MVNEASVLEGLRKLPGVGQVEAIDFAQMSALDQMRRVCRAQILVGVHGSGMEWGHFLNCAQVRRAGAPLAGSLELHYPGWPCYYTSMMERVGLAAICQMHSRAHQSGRNAKDDDLLVNVAQLLFGVRKLVEQLSGRRPNGVGGLFTSSVQSAPPRADVR